TYCINVNKKLPIGVSSFEKIRTDNYYYVDKTHFIRKLIDQGSYYFLSRPRRFGKSLFLDTIKCAFEGKKELFENLFLEKNWDWSVSFPVIRIDFSKRVFDSNDLINKILQNLDFYFQLFQLPKPSHYNDYQFAFEQLIIQIYNKYSKQVVLLVDEYDKPILDNIENPQIALHIRETLKAFYQTIKPLDKYLKFVFITGISKFAKVSLFSGLNQLRDITLSKEYSTICGYTHYELLSTFGDLLNSQEEIQKIQEWYNGYSWCGELVYNPFDILLYLQERQFLPYWFETGTPSFLMKVLQQKQFYIPQLEKTFSSDKLLESFDIEFIEPEALLFQTGYLTIKDQFVKNNRIRYVLSYPNLEVKISLNETLSSLFAGSTSAKEKISIQLEAIFDNGDLDFLPGFLNNLFAQIPFQWYTRTYQYEAFYCTVFYVFLVATGINVIAEDTSSTGNIDLTVLYRNTAYIFEFKVDKGQPIEQILTKQYYSKYLHYEKIFAIGIVVDSSSKSIKQFQIQKIK
ncbi:MAG: AAA family ATPase, partial [bacterium]